MLIDHVEVVEDVGLVGCPMQTCPPECSDVLTRTCPCECTACQKPRMRGSWTAPWSRH